MRSHGLKHTRHPGAATREARELWAWRARGACAGGRKARSRWPRRAAQAGPCGREQSTNRVSSGATTKEQQQAAAWSRSSGKRSRVQRGRWLQAQGRGHGRPGAVTAAGRAQGATGSNVLEQQQRGHARELELQPRRPKCGRLKGDGSRGRAGGAGVLEEELTMVPTEATGRPEVDWRRGNRRRRPVMYAVNRRSMASARDGSARFDALDGRSRRWRPS